MKIAENTQVKFPNLPRELDNVLTMPKNLWVGKRTEEKEDEDVVSLRGDLIKAKEALANAQEEMGMAKKAMA